MNTKKNKARRKKCIAKRDNHTVRFLKWIRIYPGWWYLICTPGNEHMNINIMKMLIERLAKEQFYEIIFVLLMVHRNADFMDSVFKTMLLEMMLNTWQGEANVRQQFIRDLTNLFT